MVNETVTKKPWILITDFDNTMSKKDFYQIVIDDYIGPSGRDYYIETKKIGKISIGFLNVILGWRIFTRKEHDEMLLKVTIDKNSKKLVEYVEANGGDFMVLSAGFDYYIHKTLQAYDMGSVDLITNPGVYNNGKFIIQPDTESPYYSSVYGIDKGKVILDYKKSYDKVIFIGDSEPDYHAAIHADVVFAKEELYELMVANKRPCYHIDDYQDVLSILSKL